MSLYDLVFPKDKVLTVPKLIAPYVKCSQDKQESNESVILNSTIIQNNSAQPLSASPLYFTGIHSARILCEGADIKTRLEIFLNIKDLEFNFLPGDSIGILPENPKGEVDKILEYLDLQEVAEHPFKISLDECVASKKKIPSFIPSWTTPRQLLQTCLDVRSIVKKAFIRSLINYTTDSKEKRRLEELCSKEGTVEYNKHILEKATCLLDILQTFPTCKPPISLLIEHLPRLMPRAYSIASSPLVHPYTIRIVFNLVKDSRERDGICTSWLYEKIRPYLDLTIQLSQLSLKVSEKIMIPIFLRKSNKFRIPDSPSVPLIMIGPGTGVAPFLGFLEHRYKQTINKEVQQMQIVNILLFGCRFKDKDYLYKDDLENYFKKKIINKLMVCFSRENGSSKYVQDLFRKEKEFLVNLLIQENTFLFICGDALNMAKDVENAIVTSISEVQGISMEEANIFLQNMEKDGKFLKDIWR